MKLICPFCAKPLERSYINQEDLVTCSEHSDSSEELKGNLTFIEYVYKPTDKLPFPSYAVFQHENNYLYVNFVQKYSRLFRIYLLDLQNGDSMWDSLFIMDIDDADWDLSDLNSTMARIKTLHAFH